MRNPRLGCGILTPSEVFHHFNKLQISFGPRPRAFWGKLRARTRGEKPLDAPGRAMAFHWPFAKQLGQLLKGQVITHFT